MNQSVDKIRQECVFYCRNEVHEKFVWITREYVADENDINCASCPICDQPTQEVPKRFLTLKKMWDAATGPQTPEGKRRSRLNSYQHGAYAQIPILLAPALTGKYLECETCQYAAPCSEEKWQYCPVQVEPMMKFLMAYEEGNINDLRDLAAMCQGHLFNILRMAFQQVYKKGIMSEKTIRESVNRQGEKVTMIEWQSNPILNRIPELMQQLGFSADQQMMTPKVESDDANIKGYLKSENQREVDLKDHTQKVEKTLDDLKIKIQHAVLLRSEDGALQRYNKQIESEKKEKDVDQQ